MNDVFTHPKIKMPQLHYLQSQHIIRPDILIRTKQDFVLLGWVHYLIVYGTADKEVKGGHAKDELA